jgi:EXLDI family protein
MAAARERFGRIDALVNTAGFAVPRAECLHRLVLASSHGCGIRIQLRITHPVARSYDAAVPNKTIYVSDGDLALYQRAQELAGGNLSSAIASALRRYVDVEQGRREGFDEIVVRVGSGKQMRKVRFSGVLVGEWVNSSSSRGEIFRVYRSRTGKFVVHIDRTPEWRMVDADGKPAGWRGALGLDWNVSYGTTPAESTLEVVDSLDALREKIPPQLHDMVAGSLQHPPVEDLDI